MALMSHHFYRVILLLTRHSSEAENYPPIELLHVLPGSGFARFRTCPVQDMPGSRLATDEEHYEARVWLA